MDVIIPKVPVIGLQPRQVKYCGQPLVTQIILCDCGSPVPVVIPGLDRAGFCPACKTKWVIAKILFKNDNGMVSMDYQVAKWNGPMSASRELEVGLTADPESTRKM